MPEYIISSGEISSGIILENNSMTVLDGGVATETTVNNRASMTVSSGGTANSTTVNSGGRLYISGEGITNSTMVNSGARLQIESGATATGIRENGGYVHVMAGADVAFAPNTISGFSLNQKASATIHSGTTATDTTIAGGSMYVFSGGSVNGTTVNSDGRLYVSSGGTANSATVNSDGRLYVSSGATAGIVFNPWQGTIYSNSGANVTYFERDAKIYFGETRGIFVSKTDTADSLTIVAEQSVIVFSGGTANNTTVNAGGFFTVSSGATATEIKENGGYVHVEDGANVSFKSCTLSGLELSNVSATVHSGTTPVDVEVNTDAWLYVFSGGTAGSGVTVNSGGTVVVMNGGVASGLSTTSSGFIVVSSGGLLEDACLSGGISARVVTVEEGGIVSSTRVLDGVDLYVSGSAYDIVLRDDTNPDEWDRSDLWLVGGFAENLTMEKRAFFMASSAVANNITVNSSCEIYVSTGGVVNNITINFGGSAAAIEGGAVNSTTINSGGSLDVSSGGKANGTTVNSGGRFYVLTGGTANGTTLNSGGFFYVYYGTANDTTVNSGGSFLVSSGGITSNTTINSGAVFYVSGDCTTDSATINNGGRIHVLGSGIAENTTVNSGGSLFVSGGGTTDSATINNGGRIHVLGGGVAENTTVNSGGSLLISKGGVAENTTVNSGGIFYVSSGVIAENTTVNSGGGFYVSRGGSANSTTVSGGYFHVSSGGTATDITIRAGARLEIGENGMIHSAVIQSGGLITGHIDCRDVTFDPGATLQFDLSVIPPGKEGALVNLVGLAEKPDSPSFSLTVSDEQAEGTYSLAEGAANFAGTISVVNTAGKSLGTLTVGETVRIGGDDYTLNLTESLLSVSVVHDETAPVIKLSADTETVVLQTTLTATVDDGSTIEYRIGKFGLWKEYKEPIIASLNETYYFMAMDEEGNIGTNQITFGNIDTSGVLLSTLWSQRGINPMGGNTTIMYNEYTPLDPSVTPEAHCLTGCVNTAAGQLIYYFIEKGWLDLPLTLEEKDEYTSKHKATTEGGDAIVIPVKSDGSTPGTLSFAEINAMLSDFQLDSAEHAAALLYAIGVVLESKYSASSTGTSWNRVFFKRAGFEGETMGGPYFGEYYWGDMDDEMQYTITDAGFEVLIENLEAGLPVGATYPGHAFVIDGYDRESDTFHINLGWGGNQATRWYTRDEMQEELNCEYFVYDLNPEYVETFTVTDARVYGTGTMIRAFEQAAGMIGDNTVAFDPSVAGKTVELLNHITFFDEVISVKDFNMNVLVTESQGGENSYGFYADHIDVFESSDPVTVLTFHASGGSLIVSTEEEFNYAFQMEEALSCTVDADGMLIYGGKTSEGTDAAAVLQTLQTCRSENMEVSDDLLDPNGWSYNGSAGIDVLRLANSSLAVGKVSLGGGDDVLALTGHSRLYGTIDTGDGNDSITVDSTSSVSGDLAGKSKLNFVLAERNDHAMFTVKSSVSDLCTCATVSVDMKNAEIGTYTLISAASGATGITDLQKLAVIVTGSGGPGFTLSVNGISSGDYADLIYEDNSLKLQIKAESGSLHPASDVAPQIQTWEKVEGARQYLVEYSTDNFEHVIQLAADSRSTSLDSFQLPAGSYQMRVKADDGEWTVLEPVVAEEPDEKPKLVISDSDGGADVFFVNPVGTWESGYVAQHVGSTDDTWGGTKENVKLVGRNKLLDVFEGSTNANTLLMTDDSNGDALFVDDIYSASPGELGLSQSRINLIDEIRAGAGDDIVDMTSRRFEYTGEGLTLRGGDGDDTIWANKGDNWLFGDAGNDRIVGASGNDVIAGGIGNDRMHGGGGSDVFTFCDNWGTDEVEQLTGSSVTLWFAESESQITASELDGNSVFTNAAGTASVTVKGFTLAEIAVKYGNDGSSEFATLSGTGAFTEFTSQKIFEESGKGILASM